MEKIKHEFVEIKFITAYENEGSYNNTAYK